LIDIGHNFKHRNYLRPRNLIFKIYDCCVRKKKKSFIEIINEENKKIEENLKKDEIRKKNFEELLQKSKKKPNQLNKIPQTGSYLILINIKNCL
jgi:hypothetical protein